MITGNLKKMRAAIEEDQVKYYLHLSENANMNLLIGKEITLEWYGTINCVKCTKLTKKSFGDGFCYSCFISAPEAAECILRPELCRAHLGEGRDPEWEIKNHNQPHVVYLAQSSSVKVGITRKEQVPTRWIDQGASAAIILAETPNRYEAGRIEVELKSIFTDKTNWQKMLKNEVDDAIDLVQEKWSLEDQLPGDILDHFTDDEEVTELNYPVEHYPSKVNSLTFEKTPIIKKRLIGIKGQYLIFENGDVLNIRRHTGYNVALY